jgi:hypothetical protein
MRRSSSDDVAVWCGVRWPGGRPAVDAIVLALATLCLGVAVAGVPPSPSCMLNGNASLDNSTTPLPNPCPLPTGWQVDWSVANSTALMSTNPSGFHPTEHTWGWVTLDWQANRQFWLNEDPKKCECEAASARNCAQLKREGTVRRCTIYHNMELALEWIESNRAVMDQEHVEKGWFLRFANGSVYDDLRQPPTGAKGQPMPWLSQWFIDWRNAEAAAYFIEAIVNSTHLPGVDGTFTDDSVGVPTEHPTLAQELGVTNASLLELQFATQQAGNYLAISLAAAGKTCFDCIGGQVSWTNKSALTGGFGYNQRPPPRLASQCKEWMRNYCTPAMQGRGMFMEWDVRNVTSHAQTMAAFLVTRPPVAFIGSYIMRGPGENGPPHGPAFDPLFLLDVGEPEGLCSEERPGIFQRHWSKGVAALDCNTYTATLNFSSL